MYQSRKTTGRLTSALIAPSLKREYGADWLLVADDLDQAIGEWGEFVEGKIEDAFYTYKREVDKRNATRQKASAKGGREVFIEEYDKDEIRRRTRAAVFYWVDGLVVRFTAVASDDPFDPAGEGVMWKRATFDPQVDQDFSTADVQDEVIG